MSCSSTFDLLQFFVGINTELFFWDIRHLRAVQCDMRWNKKIGMKPRHWTCHACIGLAGAHASSGHSVEKYALFRKEQIVSTLRRKWMVTHTLQNSEHHVRIVEQLRQDRTVPHHFADTSFGIPVNAFWRSFFQRNAWLMHFLLGPRVAPINKVQMDPSFVMDALVGRTETKGFPMDGEGTMFLHFPETSWATWLKKNPQTSAQLSGIARVGNDTKRVQSALCTRMRIVFYSIRLRPTTSVYEVNINVVSAVTSCGVTYCATT